MIATPGNLATMHDRFDGLTTNACEALRPNMPPEAKITGLGEAKARKRHSDTLSPMARAGDMRFYPVRTYSQPERWTMPGVTP